MGDMEANCITRAATLNLMQEPVPADQSLGGAPTTGTTTLGEFAGAEVGVWEMSPGVMRDVEADELFVVLSGSATVDFADGSPRLQLGPGDVVRLAEGAQTVWTVTQTLRKVYLV